MIPNLNHQWRRLRTKLNGHQRNKMVRLPVEIYLLVFEQLERKNLHNLLFVCRDFYFPAEKVLYRNIHLECQKVPSQLQLFQTVISSERIACHIHALTISSGSACFITSETYWGLLTQVLCATRNLEGFYWLAPGVTWPYHTLHLFSGCALQLRTLVFHASYSAHIAFDNAFLDLQTQLVELDFPRIPAFPTNVFPKLTTLTVSCRGTARLINRPGLRAVHFVEPTLLLNAPWPTSNTITSLRLPFLYEHFSRIIHGFPCLRFLRLDLINLQSRDHSFKYLLAQINHLTLLEKLALHDQFLFNPFKFLPTAGTMNIHEGVRLAFRQLSSLQAITVEGGPTDICFRWLRDTNGKTIVEQNKEEWRDKCWH